MSIIAVVIGCTAIGVLLVVIIPLCIIVCLFMAIWKSKKRKRLASVVKKESPDDTKAIDLEKLSNTHDNFDNHSSHQPPALQKALDNNGYYPPQFIPETQPHHYHETPYGQPATNHQTAPYNQPIHTCEGYDAPSYPANDQQQVVAPYPLSPGCPIYPDDSPPPLCGVGYQSNLSAPFPYPHTSAAPYPC